MFRQDKGMFYRKINNTKEKKGKVPDIDKFVEFWGGIWETSTQHRSWIKTVKDKIMVKLSDVEELTITEKKLFQTIRKRKNWSAPGIDGIQNLEV